MMGTMSKNAAALLALAVLAACGTDATSAEEPAESRPSAALAESEASPSASAETKEHTPVQGVWMLKQTRKDVVTHLREFGFGDQVQRFIRLESVWAQDNWEWTFDGDTFVASWQNPDGSWKVADSGTLDVDGDRLDLHFGGEVGSTTTFAWAMQGDQLRLTWLANDGPLFKGLPDETYWRAYLTKPLTRAS